MIPSVLTEEIQDAVSDFIHTAFHVTNPYFTRVIDDLVNTSGNLFRGPYLTIKLPFQSGKSNEIFFPNVLPSWFKPYRHQERAFERLSGKSPKATLVATGTGSGKTESFLYPILDYCLKKRTDRGIKAILLYPMNALATDQARRLAEIIYNNDALRGKITAGVYVGGKEDTPHRTMGKDYLISDRDMLRKVPPDIILTNYKMLDFLLIRAADFKLWSYNEPDTLRFLVVDELHTFDGAQAADLACLIRRLKDRLKTPPNSLCSIGTSATLGGNSSELTEYAETVFGETFTNDSVVTEELLSVNEFLKGTVGDGLLPVPDSGNMEELSYNKYDDYKSFIEAQVGLWFATKLAFDDIPAFLSSHLPTHPFFRNILKITDGKTMYYPDLIAQLMRFYPVPGKNDNSYWRLVLDSIVALICFARNEVSGTKRPFLQVRSELWIRELRRMVTSIGRVPRVRFSDDLPAKSPEKYLPLVHCRECGYAGWLGNKKAYAQCINENLQEIYRDFFARSRNMLMIFPWDDRFDLTLTSRQALRVKDLSLHTAAPDYEISDDSIPVYVYQERERIGSREKAMCICPVCSSKDSFIIFGAQAATLISTMVSQLYASRFNTDKKLLAFSDSVQDASHRAGFVESRTFRRMLLTAIARFIIESEKRNLTDCLENLPQSYLTALGEDDFITMFIPTDLMWPQEFSDLKEYFNKLRSIPENKRRTIKRPDTALLISWLSARLRYDTLQELGFNARLGRSLEKTGTIVLHVKHDILDTALESLQNTLQSETEVLRDIEIADLRSLVMAYLIRLKNQGAIYDDLLKPYVSDQGNTWHYNNIPFVKKVNYQSRLPTFITTRYCLKNKRFDLLHSTSKGNPTWFDDRLRTLSEKYPGIIQYAQIINETIFKRLADCGVMIEILSTDGITPNWGLSQNIFSISRDAIAIRCPLCGHEITISLDNLEFVKTLPCLRLGCSGMYDAGNADAPSFYRKLYTTGELVRIFAGEHTGLLDRDRREQIEISFMKGGFPGDENLLSCTPTLEMGIDIGDLSSALLCSVPPAQANYLQRVGRAGRKTGSALVMTVANASPHDLYFYDEPLEMISGIVNRPGCTIDAPEVLIRQFHAYCFDRWIYENNGEDLIPLKLKQIIDKLDNMGKETGFPINFLSFIKKNQNELYSGFRNIFKESISETTANVLSGYIKAGQSSENSIWFRVLNGLQEIKKERDSHKRRIRELSAQITSIEENPARPSNYKELIEEIDREKDALNGFVRDIDKKDTLNFFTDYGILPNYAFPESGVILKSIILKKRKQEEAGKYNAFVYEYERSSSAAIREFAPNNRFYADSRVVTIDQIDLESSQKEDWRFCETCNLMMREPAAGEFSQCPDCKSPAWVDTASHRRTLLRMRQVYATSFDRYCRLSDESDDRHLAFYDADIFVDFKRENVKRSYVCDSEDFPFGFEYIDHLTLREVNFGEYKEEDEDASLRINNRDVHTAGFVICKGCGKVDGVSKDREGNFKHAITCRQKDAENFLEATYLYRELSSEAVRILIPVILLDEKQAINSFAAALNIGLRLWFKGDIGHLKVASYNAPDMENPDIRKQYLVLYDAVPGGTGYLRQLMSNADQFLQILEDAQKAIAVCPCQSDPEKDGCYRCVYNYRDRHNPQNTSRKKAEEILSRILSQKHMVRETGSLDDISVNTVLESELERMFVDRLARLTEPGSKYQAQIKKDIVQNKSGWRFEINNNEYEVVPQVQLDERNGVFEYISRADFVLYPSGSPSHKPIAVFVDGFEYHVRSSKNSSIVGLDIAKRSAIVKSGKYHVFSITYDDIAGTANSGKQSNALGGHDAEIKKMITAYLPSTPGIKNIADGYLQNNFELFLLLLAHPDITAWKSLSFISAFSLMGVSKGKINPNTAVRGIEELFSEASHALSGFTPVTDGSYFGEMNVIRNDEGKPFMAGIADIAQESSRDIAAAMVLIKLFDTLVLKSHRDFKHVWCDFLRMYNLFQFLDNAFFITSTHMKEKDNCVRLFSEEPAEELTGVDILTLDNYSDLPPETVSIIKEIFKAGINNPVVPYELTDVRGVVIASATVGYEEKKIAFLSDYEIEFTRQFKAAGWKPILIKEAANQMPDIISAFI